MARQPRFVLPGHPQHVIQRGNNRDIIFATDDDYQYFLETLATACQQSACQLHAYVLMTNHIHLLVTPEKEQGISRMMQSIGRKYVQYFNYRYRRTGTLWQGRYKASLLDSEQYLLSCYRYIELNPVRAGMVNTPFEYRWSSYGHNAIGSNNPLINPHPLYQALGHDPHQRQSAYRALFAAALPEQTLAALRHATQNSWVLGNDKFKQQIEALTRRQASPRQRGGDRKSVAFNLDRAQTAD